MADDRTIAAEPPRGPARPAPAPPPEPAAVPVPEADATAEYVAGGSRWSAYPNAYQSLSNRGDDATAEFGQQLYEVMLRDSTVGGAFELLKKDVLADEVQVLPAVEAQPGAPPDSDPDVPLAAEVADFCTYNLARLGLCGRALEDTLYELLDGMAFGTKAAELVFEVLMGGRWAGKTALARADVKPNRAWAFVVDPYGRVLGILGAVPGQGGPSIGAVGAAGDVAGSGVFLPREKFAILAWMTKDGDPRGTSCLRLAVNGWNQKVRSMANYGKFNDRHALPILFATVGPNAQPVQVADADGNPIPGAGTVPATTFLYRQLLALEGGFAMVGPAGSTLEMHVPPGDGATFTNAIRLWKEEIVFAILHTIRGVLEAEYGSRADSTVGQDDKGLVVKWVRGVLARLIRRDLLLTLVRLNYGDDAAERLLPRVKVGGVDEQDFPKTAAAVAALEKAGYLAPSQKPALDAKLKIPVRTPDEVDAAREQAEAKANPPAPNPPGTPGRPAPGDGADENDDAAAAGEEE